LALLSLFFLFAPANRLGIHMYICDACRIYILEIYGAERSGQWLLCSHSNPNSVRPYRNLFDSVSSANSLWMRNIRLSTPPPGKSHSRRTLQKKFSLCRIREPKPCSSTYGFGLKWRTGQLTFQQSHKY